MRSLPTLVVSTLLALPVDATPGLGACGAQAAGQAAPPRITVAVDTTLMNVGDRITLIATVEHDPTSTVAWPATDSIDLAPFEVLEAAVGAGTGNGRPAATLALSLTAWELGELDLPALRVPVVASDGFVDTLVGDAFVVEVTSVGIDEGGDIREIRGPMALPATWGGARTWLLLGAIAALATYLIRRRFRKRQGEAERVVPAPSPEEAAYAELDRIESSPLLARGMAKRYHIELSEVVRRYVSERFGVDAMEATTGELMEMLDGPTTGAVIADKEAGQGWLRRLRELLAQADLVKFAKARPTAESSCACLALGRELVREAARWVEEAARRAATEAEARARAGADEAETGARESRNGARESATEGDDAGVRLMAAPSPVEPPAPGREEPR